jgi:hypothetical protein
MYNGISSESQELPNNLDVMKNIPNDASVDASTLPDVAQMISSTTGNMAKGILELDQAISSKLSW